MEPPDGPFEDYALSCGASKKFEASTALMPTGGTFPFPDATEAQKEHIRAIAEQLDVHRKTQQASFPKLTLTAMYAMLERMGKESGIKTPTRADLVLMDKKRKDKKLSNEDWQSATDADARIARMKDKTTRMAYKPEHAVDLDTGAIVAAPVYHADRVDTKTVEATLEKAADTLELLEMKPSAANTVEAVADKGYFAKRIIKNLGRMHWKTRISEPEHEYWYSWNGDHECRKAVFANRVRLQSNIGRIAMRKRSELVERSFQHVLDRGGQRKTQLEGIENVQKNYFLQWQASTLVCCCAKFLG